MLVRVLNVLLLLRAANLDKKAATTPVASAATAWLQNLKLISLNRAEPAAYHGKDCVWQLPQWRQLCQSLSTVSVPATQQL